MSGERLDLTSSAEEPRSGSAAPAQPHVGVQFNCCRVYSRVYRNRAATAYVGHCPRCGRGVRLLIGPGGTDERIFQAF